MIPARLLAAMTLTLALPAAAGESPAFAAFEQLCERNLTSFEAARPYFSANGWSEAEGILRQAGGLVGGFDADAVEIWFRDTGATFELATVARGRIEMLGGWVGRDVPFFCRLLYDPAEEAAVVSAMTSARQQSYRKKDPTPVGIQYLWGPRHAGTAYTVQTSEEDKVYVYVAKMVVQ